MILILIIGLFFTCNVVAFGLMADQQSANRTIVNNALASVVGVSRLGADLARERLLVDEHIFQKSGLDMDRLEAEIAEVEANYRKTAGSYNPLAMVDGERAVWERLEAEVEGTRARLAEVIRLSRLDRDADAAQLRLAMRPDYDAIFMTLEELTRIEQEGANLASKRIDVLQRRSLAFLGLMTLSGTLLALGAAAYLTHLSKRRNAEISQWADILERRNRELDAFAGRVAHDLRGPLTTISFSASQLAERAPREGGTSDVMRRAVARMERLIQDLLTLSRIDAQTALDSVPASSIAAAVEEDLASSVREVGGNLWIDVEPARIRCGEGLLRQALWNLGENAVKYRRLDIPLGVEFQGRDAGGVYEFRVSDNGSGMSPEEARRAFEPFFRGERAHGTPGTGLGLSIVRRVVEANGGKITLESQPGQGTTFILTLPLVGSRDG
jgi:signal transduction histidine kinase